MKEVIESTSKSRGISLWTALGLVLGLAGASALALGILVYYWKADKARTQRLIESFEVQRMKSDLEQKQAAQAAQLAQARNRQNDVRAQAQQATNLLGRLWNSAQRLNTEASALRTNEAGRKIGLHADLVATARRLYESELRGLPSSGEILGKLENARRVEQQMADALGTTYEPEPGFAAALQTDLSWSGPELRQVERCQSLLTALGQEARAKSPPATLTPEPPNLEAAMAQLAQTESVFRQRIIMEATEQAKPQAAQLIADAERERIMQEARWEATNVISEMRVLFEQQNNERLVREAEFQKALIEAQLRTSNMAQAMEEMRAQHARDVSVRQAEQKVQEVKIKVQVADHEEEARKIALRRKAQDPQLQALLAPFTTPGYRQYRSMSTERQPFSYTALQSCGALMPTMTGLHRLAELGIADLYRERPRWKVRGGLQAWAKFPESIEQIKEAQAALLELGPVLVELNLLSP